MPDRRHPRWRAWALRLLTVALPVTAVVLAAPGPFRWSLPTALAACAALPLRQKHLIAVGAAALAAISKDEQTREAANRLRLLAKLALSEMRAALGLLGNDAEVSSGSRRCRSWWPGHRRPACGCT
ncbi:MAG: hypothetical protein ACR2G2_19665 [Pseudonocardia sp.]